MKVVLDTNVLLVSISSKSQLHWIFQKLLNQDYTLCVTTDILAEYAEIIEQHIGAAASNSVLGVLENLPNIEFITTYYKFQLLKDEDDDKFVDCAIASNANFIVSHDKDFKILKKVDFPKVHVINTEEFKEELNEEINGKFKRFIKKAGRKLKKVIKKTADAVGKAAEAALTKKAVDVVTKKIIGL